MPITTRMSKIEGVFEGNMLTQTVVIGVVHFWQGSPKTGNVDMA